MTAYLVSEMVNNLGLNDPSMPNNVGEKLLIETNPVRVTGGYHHKVEKPKSDKPWFKENPNA